MNREAHIAAAELHLAEAETIIDVETFSRFATLAQLHIGLAQALRPRILVVSADASPDLIQAALDAEWGDR